MKTLSLLLIGALLLADLPVTRAASLYDDVKEAMDKELRSEKPDDEVKDFIAAIAADNEWGITADEVESVVRGSTDVCAKHETLNGAGCHEVLKRIMAVVSYENAVRSAGRRMQAVATGYEVPVSEIPRKAQTLFGDLNSVVNIWKAGAQTPGQAGTKTIPSVAVGEESKAIDPLVANLASTLENLQNDERIAAVWRYQYGVRLVRDKRKPTAAAPDVRQKTDNGNTDCGDTERRLLCKRWDDVENALEALWTKLLETHGSRKDTPAVYYLSFPETTAASMPKNMIVWARMDTDPTHPSGDVGLQWTVPLDPVLPSLTLAEKPLPGGTYPPEPPQKEEQDADKRKALEKAGELDAGSGLCSMSFARKGYLCRPLETTSAEGCPDPEDQDKDSIVLVSCTFQGIQKKTIAGPDVCGDIAWNEGKNDPAASGAGSASASSNPSCGCSYDISCQANCATGNGFTTLKNADGHISVCIATSPAVKIPQKYVLAHEMAHVRQFCTLPQGTDPLSTKEGCCGYEYDAHLVDCGEMQADGLLAGTPFTVNSCATVLANQNCKAFGANACGTVRNGNFDDLIRAVAVGAGNVCPVPPEDRNKKKEMNMCPCTPKTLSAYGNTIGNNLCFIGQCAEQTLETHRVTPGRVPAGVQDAAFPNDDPLAGSPLGNFLASPTAANPILPPYRPLLPVREFEAALCALAGLPAGTPPILCTLAAERRLQAPLADPLSTMLSLSQMQTDQRLSSEQMQLLAQSVGTRMGTELYGGNLRMMSKSLAEVIGMATKLLGEMQSIDFPTEMCPLGPAATPAPPQG